MQTKIETLIAQFGFKHFGFCSVDEYLMYRKNNNIIDEFSEYEIGKEYKSIIALALPYPANYTSFKGKGYGKLSIYCYGDDYHKVFSDILLNLCEELTNLGIQCKNSVDTGILNERLVGYLTGIGYFGKNNLLINKEYGTYFFIGTILLDEVLTKSLIDYDDCLDCRICIDACPTNSLEYGFSQETCLSNLSQVKKSFSLEEINFFKTMIYGCDICQMVCPKNKGLQYKSHPLFQSKQIEDVSILDLMKMTNKEYLNVYGNNASSWKGKLVIQRNGICLLANQRYKESIPMIEESIKKYDNVSWYKDTALKVIKILGEE